MTPGAPALPQRFADSLGQLLGPDFPTDLGLAVSGGGDSMAMLHLAAGWARVYGLRLWPVTVDHGLRPESAAEATLVAEAARGLGLPHAVLRWEGWDRQGNLQDAARRARLDLIGRWRGRVRHVLFAHTRDDQAETFLLRLRRGSGVEGLAAMRPVREVASPEGPPPAADGSGPPPAPRREAAWYVVRPLLDTTREELRHYLRVLRIPHAEDPSNDDTAYERVRMRRLLPSLDAAGLGAEVLAATAGRMRRAAEALGRRAHEVAQGLARVDWGDVLLDRAAFAQIEAETQLRLLAGALQFVSSAEYRPRLAQLEQALDRVLAGGGATLHGCVLAAEGREFRVFREHAAVAGAVSAAQEGCRWDGRWRIGGAAVTGGSVRALGEDGLASAVPLPHAGAPRAALLPSPSIWREGRLLSCRRIGFGPAYDEHLDPPGGAFPMRLLVH